MTLPIPPLTISILAAATLLASGCSGDTGDGPVGLDPFAEATVLAAKVANPLQLSVPDEHPNGPFYSLIGISPFTGALRFPHTEEWGVVPFVRQLSCVPGGFNLLAIFDPPGAFGCPSTVAGHLLFGEAGPPPSDLIMSQLHGTGAVPVIVARWSEIEPEIADGSLTLPELLALPSAVGGTADFYKETVVTGHLPPGQVAFKLVATGMLTDGSSFRLHYTETEPGSSRTRLVID